MAKFTTPCWLERDRCELLVHVTFTMTPVIPATWDSPAEGGEIEITSAIFAGDEIELTPAEQDQLCDWIASEDWSDEPDTDHMRDARRDYLLTHGDML